MKDSIEVSWHLEQLNPESPRRPLFSVEASLGSHWAKITQCSQLSTRGWPFSLRVTTKVPGAIPIGPASVTWPSLNQLSRLWAGNALIGQLWLISQAAMEPILPESQGLRWVWEHFSTETLDSGRSQWLMSVIPALWEAEASRSPEVRSLRPAWPTWWNPISNENIKITRAWWRVPVVPATREAEAGEFLEPGRRRLQWAKIVPPQPGWQSKTLSQRKKKWAKCGGTCL